MANTCIGCGASIETGPTKMYCELCKPLGIDVDKRANSMQEWMAMYWASQRAGVTTVTPDEWRAAHGEPVVMRRTGEV